MYFSVSTLMSLFTSNSTHSFTCCRQTMRTISLLSFILCANIELKRVLQSSSSFSNSCSREGPVQLVHSHIIAITAVTLVEASFCFWYAAYLEFGFLLDRALFLSSAAICRRAISIWPLSSLQLKRRDFPVERN